MADVRVEPLSIREKLCYSAGEFGAVMMYYILSLYANIFLLEVAQLTPLAATAIVFGSRVLDVLAYPLLIPVLNTSKPNKWGKYKTWMVASVMVFIPPYILGWVVPDIDDGAKIAWYLVFHSLYLIAQTAYTMAHRTLLMYMTEDPDERDSATTYQVACQPLSLILAIAIHGQIVAAFGTTDSASCINSALANTSSNGTVGTVILNDPETGYLVSAGTTSVMTLLAVSTAVFVKEYTASAVPGDDTSRGTLLKDIWEVCTFRPFADLLGIGVFAEFGKVLQQWSAALAVQHGFGVEDQLQNLLLAFLVSVILATPISDLLCSRFGKKTVLMCHILLDVASSVGLMFTPGRLDLLFLLFCLTGIASAGPTFIPWTMLMDVADDFKVQKGKRRDMLCQTLYQCLVSASMLLASVTSLIALEIGGYQTGACTQPDTVAFTTRLLVSFMPAGMDLFSLVFLWRFQLTHERLKANKAILEERRNQSANNININGTGADNSNTNGTEPQPSLAKTSHDLPDKTGPVQLNYIRHGIYGSFRLKRL